MKPQRVIIFGGTGFVGQSVCEAMQRAGLRVTVPTRSHAKGQRLAHLPNVTVLAVRQQTAAELIELIKGHDVVINLIAILHGSRAAFEKAHVTWTAELADACEQAHLSHPLQRVIHVSALGAAADAPSDYQQTKAAGEAIWQSFKACPVAILRPSVIFGARDQFLNLFAKLVALTPVMPLAGAHTRFQPVSVQDVAQAIMNLTTDAHPNITAATPVECVGPDTLTLKSLVQLVARWTGRRVWVFNMPKPLAMLQAGLMELAPGPTLMSRDNVRSLAVDNVAAAGATDTCTLAALGIKAQSLYSLESIYRR